MSGHHHKEFKAAEVTIPQDSGWRKLPFIGLALFLVGTLGTFAVGDSLSPDVHASEHADGTDDHAEDGHAEDGHAEDGHAEDGHAEDGHAEDGHAEDGHAEDAYAGDAHAEDAHGGGHGVKNTHLWAWLMAVMFWVSIGVGSTFFLVIFYLSRGGWHIAIRRPVEAVMSTTPFLMLLLVPIFFLGFEDVFTWAAPAAADDPILASKAAFLNKGFFIGRFVFYLAIYAGITTFIRTMSRKQDKTGDPEITRKLQAFAAPMLAIMALTATFFAFDWMMSTDAHWFSTMYGIIFFAGGFMANFAVLAILIIGLAPLMGGAVTMHHRHGVGKMMWGLMVFWAYTSFSQFMLIWYANIPEETMWFEHRWENGWMGWTVLLFLGHFIIPFFALMSRHVKREPRTLFLGAVWLLLMHYVDIFWQVKPNMGHGHGAPVIGVTEILAFVGVGGLFLALTTFFLCSAPLVPIKDPRLPESLSYEDV